MNIKNILNQSLEYKLASKLLQFTDSVLKSKLNNVVKKYSGLYSDMGWSHIYNLQNDLKHVLPNLSVFKSYYDNKMPNESKTWVMIGAFNNSKPRAVWINIKASGAGSTDDPLSKYDVIAQVEILSPKNLDFEAERFFNEVVD